MLCFIKAHMPDAFLSRFLYYILISLIISYNIFLYSYNILIIYSYISYISYNIFLYSYISQQPYNVSTVVIPILKMWKLKQREIQWLAQHHPAQSGRANNTQLVRVSCGIRTQVCLTPNPCSNCIILVITGTVWPLSYSVWISCTLWFSLPQFYLLL